MTNQYQSVILARVKARDLIAAKEGKEEGQ